MESMKRVASKSAKRSVSNPAEGADGHDGGEQQEPKEKPKPKIKVRKTQTNKVIED